MKIFKFVGSVLGHTEALIDSTFGTAISASNTVGHYVNQQEQIALATTDIVVTMAVTEAKLELKDLRDRLINREVNKPADVDTKRSVDEILAEL